MWDNVKGKTTVHCWFAAKVVLSIHVGLKFWAARPGRAVESGSQKDTPF